ncbi:hypothetical protein BCV72DRAFT_233504 [Rhizopus microsporus var. microsporus]|uniref:Uncharacterized protein n=2 Tax=Rhizopus microsporus TaxID=58291 RepID=A0A2G4T647_RHIZD|nr:uncharacterized protein RHIMIDRAFT_266201 [Rhizopus microsporus ATCC 52813]ORE03176.1 hypothetical protein BCV72DRAFT_233504 [Rhizopus microsporus var. microsporus]PHZ16490.1 hypothetical protein RHIMIDRAFT_266201 [Rhizopus microsporus ATCC 52813]
MTRTREINIKRLQDSEGTEQEIKKMKLSTMFYLKQLGFNQYDISTLIDLKHTSVQAATNRVTSTGTNLTEKSTG